MSRISQKDKAIHDEFSRYGMNAKQWMNKCVLMLPKIEKNRIWEKKGFSCIYEYVAKIAGMSRNKVNEGLRILKKTEDLPAIREVIESRGIFAVKSVVSIATSETDKFWAVKASEMKKSTLEAFVKDFRNEQEKSQKLCDAQEKSRRPGAGSPTNNLLNKPNLFEESVWDLSEATSSQNKNSESKIQLSMKLDQEIVDALNKIKGADDWNKTMRKLINFSKKALETEQNQLKESEEKFQKELQEQKPKPARSNNRKVTAAIKKYILKRSGAKCEHPNCSKQGKHIHHIEPFAIKKQHDPDKLIYLCAEHHQIIHLGYINDDEVMYKVAQLTAKPQIEPWKQIQKLPSYDIKNAINERVLGYKQLLLNKSASK